MQRFGRLVSSIRGPPVHSGQRFASRGGSKSEPFQLTDGEIMTAGIRTSSWIALASSLLFAAGCGNDESPPVPDEHTPVSYTVLINGNQVTAPYTLTEGVTVRVQLKFLNAASEDLDDVESQHFAGLT